MSNQVLINGIPLSDDHIKAIQLSLQNQIEILEEGLSNNTLNEEGIFISMQIIQASKAALDIMIHVSGKFYKLCDIEQANGSKFIKRQ
jgi:hypothetical protein